MKTTTLTLVEFLTARLNEDEAVARAVKPYGHTTDMGGNRLDEERWVTRGRPHGEDGRYSSEGDKEASALAARFDPARVLREVEAKRFLLALAEAIKQEVKHLDGTPIAMLAEGRALAVQTMLRRLAAVYSDHPDYDPSWGSGRT